MKYRYFVSWIYCEHGKTQYANCEVMRRKKVCCVGDVVEMSETIRESNGLNHNPTIMFYELFADGENRGDTE